MNCSKRARARPELPPDGLSGTMKRTTEEGRATAAQPLPGVDRWVIQDLCVPMLDRLKPMCRISGQSCRQVAGAVFCQRTPASSVNADADSPSMAFKQQVDR